MLAETPYGIPLYQFLFNVYVKAKVYIAPRAHRLLRVETAGTSVPSSKVRVLRGAHVCRRKRR